jgi:hypothetical protein
MRKKLTRFLFIFSGVCSMLLYSCEKHDHEVDPHDSKEYRFIRIMVSDENSPTLSFINPVDGAVVNFTSKYSKSTPYTTESNRYLAIVHRENSLTETFDVGFEFHGDHIDVKGTPKFGAMTGESLQPTHFKSKRGEFLTFNDGDGTLSVGAESDIHTPGAKIRTINAGLLKHHGAMATFSNGNYAVTVKDNSIAGTLPEKVKIINSSGVTIHEAKLATQGIHGNATDGSYAVFGSSSGILIVESNGNQRLLPHPDNFGTAWFGTILETAFPGKFIGYTAAKGAYLINVTSGTIKPLIENTDIMQCKVSFDKKKLGILLHSGDLKLYDLITEKSEKETKAINATDKASTQKPQLELTQKFAYITSPATGELVQMSWNNTSDVRKIKTGPTPYRIAIAGHESNAGH